MASPQIHRTASLVGEALPRVLAESETAIRERGVFRLSLCGGGTPRALYQALKETSALDWSKVEITFGDERCVPPTHERSNFRMANEALLSHVPIEASQVLRMEGELPPKEAAERYETALRQRAASHEESIYRHDLLLLGMGDDGHTASLFPQTTALTEASRWVVANEVPKFEETRLTMTYPLINAARHVCFLVSGEAKRPVYERIFAGQQEDPAARVTPTDGVLSWILAE